jgi:hypothetical protein
MQAQPDEPPVEIRPTEAHAADKRDDPWVVLVQVLYDALADMDEAEQRSSNRNRRIPRG